MSVYLGANNNVIDMHLFENRSRLDYLNSFSFDNPFIKQKKNTNKLLNYVPI